MTAPEHPLPPPLVAASFVDRPNRFVLIADLDGGDRVLAHLPNTGRLTHLTTPGRRFVLRRETDPGRRTAYTAVRAWDGCWVALEAHRAPHLLVDWLGRNPLPGHEPITHLESEVALGRHRIDLLAHTASGVVWLEVKSGGRADGQDALLSQTPSTRAGAQLEVLAQAVSTGGSAVVAFVVQRPDVRRLRVGGDADQGWIDAVRTASAAGVSVLAFGCAVTPSDVSIDRELPLVWS